MGERTLFHPDVLHQLRAQRPDIPQRTPVQIAHKKDLFLGGDNTIENLQALTVPEHALDHLNKGMHSTGKTKRIHLDIVQGFVEEMSEADRKAFNSLVRGYKP